MDTKKLFTCILILAGFFVSNACASNPPASLSSSSDLDVQLRKIIALNEVQPIEKQKTNPAKVELGRLLFWDKILSGNKNISCATCHLPEAATADALPLSIGEGGEGVMMSRKPPLDEKNEPVFVPRNATDLFNRGEFVTFFWDGRVMVRKGGKFVAPVAGSEARRNLGLWTPAAFALPEGLDNGLAAQTMFPPTSDTEMRGNIHENPIGRYQRWEWTQIWSALMERLLAVDEYVQMFKKAYPNVPTEGLAFTHAANAIAAFEIDAFTLIDAPFDQYLRGDDRALSVEEKKGALIFYGKGRCGRCHSGKLMTDQIFHNRIVPQIGPGKGSHIPAGGVDGTWDAGRGGVTGVTEHFYNFRTPPLRNVEKTGPWMHDGAYATLEATVRHELDPLNAMKNYDPYSQLPEQYAKTFRKEQMNHIANLAIRKSEDIERIELNDDEFNNLIAFLKALTSPSLDKLLPLTPAEVPSGLPVED
jgi:cytochrome c peroxidase